MSLSRNVIFGLFCDSQLSRNCHQTFLVSGHKLYHIHSQAQSLTCWVALPCFRATLSPATDLLRSLIVIVLKSIAYDGTVRSYVTCITYVTLAWSLSQVLIQTMLDMNILNSAAHAMIYIHISGNMDASPCSQHLHAPSHMHAMYSTHTHVPLINAKTNHPLRNWITSAKKHISQCCYCIVSAWTPFSVYAREDA